MNKNRLFPKKNVLIREFLLINFFTINLFVSTISNYSIASFILKIVSAVCLLGLIIRDTRTSGFKLITITGQSSFNKFLIVLGIFILLPAVTLSYSLNPLFGLKKLLYLLIGTIPAVMSAFYLLYTLTEERTKVFIYILLTETVVSIILILIISPFSDFGIYHFSVTNWSHVIYGRFIGTVLLISVFLQLKIRSIKKLIYLSVLVLLFSYTAYYTGLRASLIGLSLLILAVVIFYLVKKELKIINITALIIALLSAVFLAIQFPNPADLFEQRYENLINAESLENSSDGAIQSRIDSYKICLERIEQHPFLGLGFGGFKSFYKNNIPIIISYPHNLFLEFIVEMGIPGLLLLMYLLFLIFKYSYSYSFEVFVFFLYALFLALFSKDIPTNTMLWIGLAFIGSVKK